MKKLVISICAFLTFFTLGVKVYSKEETVKEKMIICIDPGHQRKADPRPEAMNPWGGGSKQRVTQGTIGIGTKKAEYAVNLEASLILKEKLQSRGYEVLMTRETHEVNISNGERARLANEKGADLVVRIHCDSVPDTGKSGATILIPSCKNKCTEGIFQRSKLYSDILKEELKSSNIKVTGTYERNDVTGFNWSKVPVVILEMGFMSNWSEDRMLSDSAYQEKLMEATAKAIDRYKNEINLKEQ